MKDEIPVVELVESKDINARTSLMKQSIKQSLLETGGNVQQANRQAYKDMSTILYVVVTLGLFYLEVLGGIFIQDITIVFNFASALGVTCLAFWFPAGYYLKAVKKFEPEGERYITMSWIFMGLGVFNFILGIAAAVITLVEAN